jgi:hypothetical protein
MAIDDPTLPIMASIAAILKVTPGPLSGRYYNPVPAGAVYPYASLGNVQIVAEHADCLEGAELYVTIDGWSKDPSKAEIGAIGKWIIAQLDDADLSTDDVSVNSCMLDSAEYLEDPDGLTSHFTSTFHILTD